MKNRFILVFTLCLSLLVGVLFLGCNSVLAHTVLPPEIIQYMNDHPEASDEELQAMVDEYLDKYEQEHQDDQFYDSEEIYDTEGRLMETSQLIQDVAQGQTSFWTNAFNFIILGIEHILSGMDHILFVVSLVLILISWRKIMWMVSTFTVAHSLTLILAGTGLLTMSARIVEPIIAFSIAYSALTAVFLRHIPFFSKFRNKLLIIFVFGTFHGLGFAGVFTEVNVPADKFLSSLLFFNVGVEFGQILILGIVLPFLYYLSEYPKVYNRVIKAIAVSISLLSLFWMVERVV